ncbi:MAG: hypothetical protein M0C28_41675 [Candidatus Moduliflexus flocculans]|nr:hypothetical protein [Candidatus Moduliflexus flocculans]
MAFSPDGALLASAGADRGCSVWDAQTGALVSGLGRRGPPGASRGHRTRPLRRGVPGLPAEDLRRGRDGG